MLFRMDCQNTDKDNGTQTAYEETERECWVQSFCVTGIVLFIQCNQNFRATLTL